MKLLRSAIVAGIAKKVIDEARKPQNQAKIKAYLAQARLEDQGQQGHHRTPSVLIHPSTGPRPNRPGPCRLPTVSPCAPTPGWSSRTAAPSAS